MGFYEAFDKMKAALKNAKGTAIDGHLALELVFTDEENAGIAYLEVADHQVRIEPYDYMDHDARLIGKSSDLAALFSGKLAWDTALAEEKLFIEGDLGQAEKAKSLIRKPAGRKPKSQTAKTAPAKSQTPPIDPPKPTKKA